MNHQQTRRYTVTQATALPIRDIEDLDLDTVELTPADLDRAGKVWAWLLGIAGDDIEGQVRAWCEVERDAPLVVALARPATEFVAWFRACEWDCFDTDKWPNRSEDDDTWAWAVLDRARTGVVALGAMARQVGLRPGLGDLT